MRRKSSLTSKIMIILLIIIIFLGVFAYNKISLDKQTELLSNTIEEQVTKLVELSTVKYNYTNIVEYDNSIKFKGLNLPLTNKSFIVKYTGYIKAGIDLATIETDVIDRETIDISMNKAKIIENVISEEDVYFYNEKESLFNKLDYEDLYGVLIEEKKKMESEVKKKGILNDAQKNGEEVLISLLDGMGFKNINIKFK